MLDGNTMLVLVGVCLGILIAGVGTQMKIGWIYGTVLAVLPLYKGHDAQAARESLVMTEHGWDELLAGDAEEDI